MVTCTITPCRKAVRLNSALGTLHTEMRVDIAIFDGDTLVSRYEFCVRSAEAIDDFWVCNVNHRRTADGAVFIFSRHEQWRMFGGIYIKEPITLTVPAIEFTDWKSIEMGKYTLAYWCRLGA